jgi:threonine aldolase
MTHRARNFSSDNQAGMCPEVLEALAAANGGHASSYGNDELTARAVRLLRDAFEAECEVAFVLTGTAANAIGLASMCQPFDAVIVHEYAHLETDECGAPGFFAPGTKLLPVKGPGGKLTPEAIERAAKARPDVHAPRVRAVSVTQATELGTVYTRDELTAIRDTARRLGLAFHMDGARLANALARTGLSPRACTIDVGVDVLSLGGTKNGMAYGEALLFFRRELAEGLQRRAKQAGQLASKMRFIAAQWVGLLERGVWMRNAKHANDMATRMAEALASAGLPTLTPCEANSVFVDLPPAVAAGLQSRGWHFYDDVGPGGARLMSSWDTTEADVDALVRDVIELRGATFTEC